MNDRLACVLFFTGLASALTSSAVAQDAHAPVALSTEQWRSDLRYLAEQMPLRHKSLFHTMTPAAFGLAVARLDADIPHLNDDEIAIRLYTIATMPEDSHTGGVGYPSGTYFPLRLRHYDNGLYVASAPQRYAGAVGGKVVRIGNVSADEAYDHLQPIVPHDADNPGLLEELGPLLLTSGHVLHGLDIEPQADRATFVIEKGRRRITLDVAPEVPFGALYSDAPLAGWVDARGTSPAPLWLQHPDEAFWSSYDPSSRTFYVQFNQVADGATQTVAQFFDDVFHQAAELPVDKFVLDIRRNNGGDNYLLKPIIVGLVRNAAIDRPGHLFAITSRSTYSAAQNLVNRLEMYTNVTFVGQPTGQHVNSFGDPAIIVLPNSKMRFGMATVWWQDNDERDRRTETDPSLAADPTFADYVANRDPAMRVIAAYRPEASLEDAVLQGVSSTGAAGGLAAYRAYASSPLHRYVLGMMEHTINSLGYALIREKRLADAVAVLTVNAQANPQSANAADSLGEAYVDAGEKAKAIVSYRRALQLKPDLASSKAGLANLESSP